MEIFNKWIGAFTKPKETFAAEKSNADFGQGAIHILIAGVVVGLISGIYTAVVTGFAVTFVIDLIAVIISQFLSWIVLGGIYFLFAKLFGGKGSFTAQLYLMALYIAPLAILSSIVALIPFAGGFIVLILAVYGLYLLTMALKEAHSYSTAKAFLSWFIPLLIIIVVLIMLVMMAMTMVGTMFGSQLGVLSTLPIAS